MNHGVRAEIDQHHVFWCPLCAKGVNRDDCEAEGTAECFFVGFRVCHSFQHGHCGRLCEWPFDVTTIHDGQVAMALNEESLAFLDRHGHPLRRDDIVIVRLQGWGDRAQFLMKRIMGVSHDQVLIGRRTVALNDQLLKEPYLNPPGIANVSYHYASIAHGGVRFKTPGYVGRNDLGTEHYWVMGDNCLQSTDSRMFGLVQRSQITERVVWAMPLSYYTFVKRAERTLLVLSPI